MVGLLFVDLDGFKTVNDTFGHAAGDEVLRTVANRMRGAVRAGDVVCRLGGDEFVIVVEDAGSEHSVLTTAHHVLAAVSRPVSFADVEIPVGASIGVGISTDGTSDADTLLGEADAAVYRAKSGGRGQVEVFDQELREALRNAPGWRRLFATALPRTSSLSTTNRLSGSPPAPSKATKPSSAGTGPGSG